MKEICSNDFGSISITEDQQFLFIQRATNQIYQIELSSDFDIQTINIENQILDLHVGYKWTKFSSIFVYGAPENTTIIAMNLSLTVWQIRG